MRKTPCLLQSAAASQFQRYVASPLLPSRMWRKLKPFLFLAFLVAMGVVLIGWWATRVSPTDVRGYRLDDLRSVRVCRNHKCADLDRSLWPELVQQVGNLESTWNVGWKNETSRDLYYVQFDWGKNGIFNLRLWTRPSIEGNVIATFQREAHGGTSFYGHYSANGLSEWLERQIQSGTKGSGARGSFDGQHNNGMHPTRHSAALIIYGSSGRVMPGVRWLPVWKVGEHG